MGLARAFRNLLWILCFGASAALAGPDHKPPAPGTDPCLTEALVEIEEEVTYFGRIPTAEQPAVQPKPPRPGAGAYSKVNRKGGKKGGPRDAVVRTETVVPPYSGKLIPTTDPGYDTRQLVFADDLTVIEEVPLPPHKPKTAERPAQTSVADDLDEFADEETKFGNRPTVAVRPLDKNAATQATPLAEARDNLEETLAQTKGVYGVPDAPLSVAETQQVIARFEDRLGPFRKQAQERPELLSLQDRELMRQAEVEIQRLAGTQIQGTVNGNLAPTGPMKTMTVKLPDVPHAVTDTTSAIKEGKYHLPPKDQQALGSIGIGKPGTLDDAGEILDSTPSFPTSPTFTERGMASGYKAPPKHIHTSLEIPDLGVTKEQWIAHGIRPGESATLYKEGGNALIVLYHPHYSPDIAKLALANPRDPVVIQWAITHRSRTVRKIWPGPNNRKVPGKITPEVWREIWTDIIHRDQVMADFSTQAEQRFTRGKDGDPIYETLQPKNPDYIGAPEQEVDFLMGSNGQDLAIDTDLALSKRGTVKERTDAWNRVVEATGMKPTQFKYEIGNLDQTYIRTEDAAIRQGRANGVNEVANTGRGLEPPSPAFPYLDARDKGWGRNAIWSKAKKRWIIFDH